MSLINLIVWVFIPGLSVKADACIFSSQAPVMQYHPQDKDVLPQDAMVLVTLGDLAMGLITR